VQSPAGFLAANTNDKKAIQDGTLSPISAVASLVPGLKIGDRIRIDFVYLGNTRWINSVTPLTKPVNMASGSGSTKDSQDMSFKVSGLRALRIDGQSATGLAVTKGRLPFVFVVGLIPNPDGGNGKPEKVSDPAMVEQLKQYLAGEDMCIDYETVDYMFVIKKVTPAMVTGTGRVIGTEEKSITNGRLGMDKVTCAQATVTGVGGTKFLLVRPDATESAALPKPSTGLADMVKGLQKDQVIQYTYYQLAGQRWLTEAQMVDNQTVSRN